MADRRVEAPRGMGRLLVPERATLTMVVATVHFWQCCLDVSYRHCCGGGFVNRVEFAVRRHSCKLRELQPASCAVGMTPVGFRNVGLKTIHSGTKSKTRL